MNIVGGFFMNGYSYPNIDKEKVLPFYVMGIGVNPWQYHVIRPNGYEYHQILYCTKGEGVLIIEDTSYPILPFMTFYLPAFIPHEYYSVGDIWDTHWVAFDGFAVKETLSTFHLNQANVFELKDHKNLDVYFKKIYNMSKSNQPYSGYYMSGLLYEFLIEYNRTIHQKSSIHHISSNEIMKSVIEYIDLYYKDNISLSNLCKDHNVTAQHLCRLFQKYLNKRPVEYINGIRIQEAKALLHHSELTIAQIAKEVGYGNCNYFCILFKRFESMTPGEYRRTQ